jgi:hypothetical protein
LSADAAAPILSPMIASFRGRLPAAALALVAAFAAGCASDRVNWDSRLGSYTYAEAVKQYGQPGEIDPLPEGGRVGYWVLPEAASYSFKFQLPDFQGNQVAGVSAPTSAMPAGGRHLGTVGSPVLKLTFDPSDKLVAAARTKIAAE